MKWRLRNKRRNSILTTNHYPDLDSASDWFQIGFIQSEAQPRSWWRCIICMEFLCSLLKCHFVGRPGGVAKCWLFSQGSISQSPSHLWLLTNVKGEKKGVDNPREVSCYKWGWGWDALYMYCYSNERTVNRRYRSENNCGIGYYWWKHSNSVTCKHLILS